ncbi:hypothetical protein EX30DRAFT_361685 [Ascodesmis nigricans]|uniref:Peptidase A22B, signal peptide peptidase n=1 Tax=Ascodesmis nigricans TaxID=341454 RepID=A0A4S2N335_9PEZI|nr:hypothetical protein EX30DRAFT_361685 [Ascodesmis nigricans]
MDVFHQVRPFLPTYTHLLAAALFPIFAASYNSLRRPDNTLSPSEARALRPSGSNETSSADSSDEGETESTKTGRRAENISVQDALMFPVTAGCVLGTLYLIIKYLDDPELLSRIMMWYFCGIGVFAVGQAVADSLALITGIIFPDTFRDASGRLFRAGFDSWKLMGAPEGAVAAYDVVGNSPTPKLKINKLVSTLLWKARRVLRARWILKATVMGDKTKKQLWIGDIFGPVFGAVIIGLYVLTDKHWVLTNIMGLSFSYSSLQLLSPTTFPIATLLLGLLFFYDIFFVFYTPLMVTVATKLDVPIKLLFPRPGEGEGARSLAMLGLGDVVIPGLVIAMALRFDLWRHYELQRQSLLTAVSGSSSSPLTPEAKKLLKPRYTEPAHRWTPSRYWSAAPMISFPKPYFKASLVGYIIGMVTTLVVMHVFKHAQPALLYLVPGVLGGIWTTALVKGEVKILWGYTEETEGEEEEEKKEETEDEKKRIEELRKRKEEEEERKPMVCFDVTLVRKPAPGAGLRIKKSTPPDTPPSPPMIPSSREDLIDSVSVSSDDDVDGVVPSSMWTTTVIGREE